MAEYLIPTSFKDGDKVTIFDIDEKIQEQCIFVESKYECCKKCCLRHLCNAVNCDGGYFVKQEK